MGTIRDIIDIDFDPDLLTSYLEKLSLEPTIPDLKDSLNVLENDISKNASEVSEVIDETSIVENIPIKQELHSDNEEEIKVETKESYNDFDQRNIFFKKEVFHINEDVANSYIKSELSSEEESSDIKIRGGPHRNKRRISKKKQLQRPTSINSSELNQQSLLFLSSGCIIQNNAQPNIGRQYVLPNVQSNNIDFHSFYSVDSLFNAKSIFTSGNLFHQTQNDITNYQSSVKEHTQIANEDTNSSLNGILDKTNIYIDNEENGIKLAYSPESGYDTSPASYVCSPSPSISENLQTCTDEELQSLINDILDLENITTPSNDVTNSVPNDVEQLKNFLKDSFDIEEKRNDESQDLAFINSQVINFDEADVFFNNLEYNQSLSERPRHVVDIQLNADQNFQNISNLSSISHPIVVKPKERKLSFKLNDTGKHNLRSSKDFSDQKYIEEAKKLLKEIKEKEQSGQRVKVIDLDKDNQSINFQRTNLHNAVLNSNIEKIYCLVEAQKRYADSLSPINNRDSNGKTALDYAIRDKLPEVIEYLTDNTGVKGI